MRLWYITIVTCFVSFATFRALIKNCFILNYCVIIPKTFSSELDNFIIYVKTPSTYIFSKGQAYK